MAALQRMSSWLSLRASISAGTTLAASPFRCGKRRTALTRSSAWGDFRSSINSSVDLAPQPQQASKQSDRTKHLGTRIAALPRRFVSGIGAHHSPIVGHFTTRYGAERLKSEWVDGPGEEMHRAVAEQEV